MRINLRLLVRIFGIVALTTIVFFSFNQSSHAYNALSQQFAGIRGRPLFDKSTINTTLSSINNVNALWATWSKTFEHARPQATKIRLVSQAANLPPFEDEDGARTPSAEHVVNQEVTIEALHSAHTSFLKLLKSWPQAAAKGIYNGKGVVTVGGGEYFGPLIIGIHMLRRSGSNLPVQVFVADQTEREPKLCDEYLPKLGAQCLVISDYVTDFKVTHYQLKSLAMLLSSFEEVLYLDSDSMPLVDPTSELFATEPYTSTGLVIWPDFWEATESPSFYTAVGLPGMPSNLPKTSSEAGQLLIDKRRHLKTLLLATYYNIYGPDYYYPLLSQGALGQGDKETFMAAALVLKASYYRVKTGVESVKRNDGIMEKGSGMVQFHPADDLRHYSNDSNVHVRPAFVHANTPKMNAGHLVDEGDLFTVEEHTRLRLWGDRDEQMKKFGIDLEKAVWELVVQTGCELADVIREWTTRKNMCQRLEEHWEAMFKDDGKGPSWRLLGGGHSSRNS